MTLSLHNFLYGAFDPSASDVDRQAADRPLAPGDLGQAVRLGTGRAEAAGGARRDGRDPAALRRRATRRRAARRRSAARSRSRCCRPSVVTARSDTMDSVMMLLLLVDRLAAGPRRSQRREARWLHRRGGRARRRLQRQAVRGARAGAGVPRRSSGSCWRGEPSGAASAAARGRGRRVHRGRAVVDGVRHVDAGARSPVPDRLDQRQRLERGVRLQRRRSDHARRRSRAASRRRRPSAPGRARGRGERAAARGDDHRSNSPAGPLRLFQYSLVGYGTRVGTILFAAIVFGLVALAPMLRRRLRPPPQATARAADRVGRRRSRSRSGC